MSHTAETPVVSRTLAAAIAAALGFAALAAGCAAAAPRPTATEVEPDPLASLADYRVGPEDVVEVSVWRNEALSRTVPVRPDGAISLPLINDVQAAGLTPMQLRLVISQLLAVFIPAPEVSVIVREVHSAKVSVLGQVIHPGRYDLRGPITVLEMLAHAGGLTPFAARSQIVVVRSRGDRIERIPVDQEQALADRHHENVLLQSGDLIFVP